MEKKLLTATQLAEKLGVNRKTVLNWAAEGRIPSIRLTAQTVRFDVDAVLATVNGQPAAR